MFEGFKKFEMFEMLRKTNISNTSNKKKSSNFSVKFVYNEPGAKFWFEPGRFRRHDVAGISNVDQLLHRNGIEGKGNFHLA